MRINQKKGALSLGVILFCTLITNSAYAQSTEEKFIWQIIYLSDETNCHVKDKRKIPEIVEITEEYFEMYKINNQKLEAVCGLSEELLEKPTSNDTDLHIIVFDEKVSEKLFLKYGYNGLYAHFDSDRIHNHIIMIATPPQFSSAYENIQLSQSLSGKLSYFILSYYGYNVESIVRTLDLESREVKCEKGIESNEKCDKKITMIHSNVSGDDIPVITPIKEIVNQKSIKYLPDDLYSSDTVKKVLHKITGWWINELIDEQMYLEIVKQIIDTPIKNNKELSITQLFIPNGFSIVDKTKNNVNSGVHTIPIENEFYTILDYIPFDINTVISETESSEIPSWFKNRAIIWHQEKLGDRVFLDGLTAIVQNGLIKEN